MTSSKASVTIELWDRVVNVFCLFLCYNTFTKTSVNITSDVRRKKSGLIIPLYSNVLMKI